MSYENGIIREIVGKCDFLEDALTTLTYQKNDFSVLVRNFIGKI